MMRCNGYLATILLLGLAVNSGMVDVSPAWATQHAAALSEGEIRKVDKEAGKMTIRHGPLANLDMPAMTMVFQVSDKAMLDQVKVGEKVRFLADKVGGQFTVTRIEPAQ